MTVGEVRRRLLGPEAFNFSLLGALLRRAKMPEKSRALLAELRNVGLAIPRGRRRAEKVTLLSALTEHEAEQLYTDFGAVSDSHFPAKEFSLISLKQIEERVDLEQRVLDLTSTRRMIDEFTQWLEMDRSEICDQVSLQPKFSRLFASSFCRSQRQFCRRIFKSRSQRTQCSRTALERRVLPSALRLFADSSTSSSTRSKRNSARAQRGRALETRTLTFFSSSLNASQCASKKRLFYPCSSQ